MAKNDPLMAHGARIPLPVQESQDSTQVLNNTGGYVFTVDEMHRALRFLVLGTTGGTYYASERKLTKENVDFITALAANRGEELVELIINVSENGRAARQDPTLFALAVCAGSSNEATRRAAFAAIPRVCRTATMLFKFLGYIENTRGWGRGLRRAVSNWYENPAVDKVAYQVIKYRNREGFTHRDVLRLAHPKARDTMDAGIRNNLFHYIVSGNDTNGLALPRIVEGYELAQAASSPSVWASLVSEYNLPWEALPDAALGSPLVWEALIPNTGLTALMRNLGRLSTLGVITPNSGKWQNVAEQFTDAENVRRSRVHPLNVLTAMRTYGNGRGYRGSNSWPVVPQIMDALDETFNLSFGNVEPSGTNVRICLDVSGSMDMGTIANSPLTPREASTAMALATVRSEGNYSVCAFSNDLTELSITKRTSLREAMSMTSRLPFQRTHTSLPMVKAAQRGEEVDAFVVYTDNEVNAGVHPYKALETYRQKSGRDAKLIVVGMTATNFTIAKPDDGGMLDVVGFDSSAPTLISDFMAGRL